MNIVKSVARYDAWLHKQLKSDFSKAGLAAKHEKMAERPFPFLRATYWRWAETILDLCPELKGAPQVLAVGDIHVENFGTWRDSEARLIWGVNDFDEAAEMPYGIDIVRLATSATLAGVHRISRATMCRHILDGYHEGLESPGPYVLDRHCEWLRNIVVVSDDERKDFWNKFDPENIRKKAKKKRNDRPKVRPARAMPKQYQKVLEAARPDTTVAFEYFERTAGTGSLGRPRYVGVGTWKGDLIVREAKVMVRSGWTLAHHGSHSSRCEEIATGEFRAPDPTYRLRGRVLVRRLSPNDYKIETEQKKKKQDDDKHKRVKPKELVKADMLHAMGRELGSIHRATAGAKGIISDLDRRGSGWLLAAVKVAANAVETEWRQWHDHYEKG